MCAKVSWNNTDFKVEGTPIFYQSWYNSGIEKMKHLLHHNSNKLLSFEEFTMKFKINTSFLTYYGLLRAAKSRWKKHHLVRKRKRRTQAGLTQKKISPTLPFTKSLLKVRFNHQTLKIELSYS